MLCLRLFMVLGIDRCDSGVLEQPRYDFRVTCLSSGGLAYDHPLIYSVTQILRTA